MEQVLLKQKAQTENLSSWNTLSHSIFHGQQDDTWHGAWHPWYSVLRPESPTQFNAVSYLLKTSIKMVSVSRATNDHSQTQSAQSVQAAKGLTHDLISWEQQLGWQGHLQMPVSFMDRSASEQELPSPPSPESLSAHGPIFFLVPGTQKPHP